MALTIAQVGKRNKRDAVARLNATKRQLAAQQAERLAALLAEKQGGDHTPVVERVHAILLANRPNSASELPPPVKVEALVQPLYDLIIATRKVAKFTGHSQSNDGKILWIKKPGCDKQFPKEIHRLSDSDIQAKLGRYELVDQVATATEIWHRYKLIEES